MKSIHNIQVKELTKKRLKVKIPVNGRDNTFNPLANHILQQKIDKQKKAK